MTSCLSGRVAVVTGAGSGIGAAIAIDLAARGARVAIVARHEPPLRSVAETIEQAGGTAHVVVSDVADPKSVVAAAESTRVNLGRPQILVNGAGFADTCLVEELTMNEVDHMIDVNLKGVIYWTKAVLPDLLVDGGDIVNIASLGGVRSFPGWSLYCAAKHGVVGFAGALAQEVADRNVRVTTICPGATATALWEKPGMSYSGPAEVMLEPRQVAATVLHILEIPRHVLFKDVLMLPAGEWA